MADKNLSDFLVAWSAQVKELTDNNAALFGNTENVRQLNWYSSDSDNPPMITILNDYYGDLRFIKTIVPDYTISYAWYYINANEFPLAVYFNGTVMDTKILLFDDTLDEDDEDYCLVLEPDELGSYTFPIAGVFCVMNPSPS